MSLGDYINFTPEKTEEFRKLYMDAEKSNERVFMFEGKEVLTNFAYFVLQYLDDRFKSTTK